jgi:hypothetical protein
LWGHIHHVRSIEGTGARRAAFGRPPRVI